MPCSLNHWRAHRRPLATGAKNPLVWTCKSTFQRSWRLTSHHPCSTYIYLLLLCPRKLNNSPSASLLRRKRAPVRSDNQVQCPRRVQGLRRFVSQLPQRQQLLGCRNEQDTHAPGQRRQQWSRQHGEVGYHSIRCQSSEDFHGGDFFWVHDVECHGRNLPRTVRCRVMLFRRGRWLLGWVPRLQPSDRRPDLC